MSDAALTQVQRVVAGPDRFLDRLGSLWAEVVAIYGDGVKTWPEDCGEYSGGIFHFFSIEIDGEGYEHIAGSAYFGWLTDDPASSVAQMEAGREAFPQGC